MPTTPPPGVIAPEADSFEGPLQVILKKLVFSLNQMSNYLASTAVSGERPSVARNVTVTQLGGKMHLAWDDPDGPVPIIAFRISRAEAGTRSAPTTPTFASAVQVKAIQAGGKTCPTSGSNTWVDDDFTIAQFKTDNPTRFSYWVQTVAENDAAGGTIFSEPVLASGSPIELLTIGAGETAPNPKIPGLNKLFNGSFISSVTTTETALGRINSIVSTNTATPIEVTTSTNHGMLTGDGVYISQCDYLNANGFWRIVKVSNTKFTLTGSSGGGVAGTLGSVFPAIPGQPDGPTFTGSEDPDGSPSWSSWLDNSSDATATAKFASDGTHATGEVLLEAPTASNKATSITQYISISKFTGGNHYTLSVSARLAPGTSPGTGTQFQISIVDPNGSSVGIKTLSGSVLTTTHQRIWCTIVFGDLSGFDPQEKCVVNIANSRTTSGSNTVYLRWPMLNPGDFPAIWSDTLDQSQGVGSYSSSALTVSSAPDYARGEYGHGQIDATYA